MNNTGVTILSILIPSIPERGERLIRLREGLDRQIENNSQHIVWGDIEVIENKTKSFLNGGLSIGKKRDWLVKKATGRYLCFLDDDETIAPNYIETLLRLCNQDQDVCTFRAMVKLEAYWAMVDMSLKYKTNDQLSPDFTVRRTPWHMCPVRSEFAKLYEFKNINNAEDYEWFEKVLSHCTTESHTEKIIFQYNHGSHSEADKIENHV